MRNRARRSRAPDRLGGYYLPQDMDRILGAGTELLGHVRITGRGLVELAGLAGVAAAILPSRRAAKLNVLRAIVSE